MFVVRASGFLFDRQIRFPDWEPPAATLQYWIEDLGVGGVILVDGSATELMVRSRQLQSWAEIPLLISADIEEGVGQRFAGATWFPPPMAIGAIWQTDRDRALGYAEQMGEFTAKEAVAIGLNWILAPVVDVNNNPDNPVINVRSFGDDPAVVSALATAFIRGTQRYPVLNCAKHFPGHGDTNLDSHHELPTLPHSPQRLAEIELPPFQAAIAAGVDSVMSAHLQIPCWDLTKPATLSPPILTGQLRQNLGFEGLIVTDAMVMGAILPKGVADANAKGYDPGEATVLAVEAGADIVLMPADLEVGIRAVCAAVASGRLSRDRILQSVERIWKAKSKVFPTGKPKDLDPQAAFAQLATPAAGDCVAGILDASLRFGGSLPLPRSTEAAERRNLIAIDDPFQCAYLDRQAPAIDLPRQWGYQFQLVARPTISANLNTDNFCVEAILRTVKFCPTLLQVFVRGNPFGTSAILGNLARACLQALLETGELQGVAVYGSPYLLEDILPKLPPNLPYAFSYGQMPQAQERVLSVLLGETPVSSHRDRGQFE
ncbi:MAG TPA: beta-glucosidase [Oscillatoriales cyanobacterium M59_W2019_021]|nr:beta-glucosidase [Oscillatoriales cyanobacterium M4454_W2019_049]HIK50872.1 beta-glucosidase [Oscillatoriales cyanobacterium M59_W2019_021]